MKTRKIEYANEKILNDFTEDEKNVLFEDLCNMYFKKNFGSVSKSDLETYLFSFYIEHLLDTKEEIDDYIIGRDLGLTISRVRALKERKELKYPRIDYEWKEEFLRCADNAKYDEINHLIKFQVTDINVLKDARYFFESHGQYDEYQLNPKLFQCRLDAFLAMTKLIAEDDNSEFVFKIKSPEELNKIVANEENLSLKESIIKISQGAVEDGLKELLISASKEVCLCVLNCIMPGSGKIVNMTYQIINNILSR